MQLLFFGFTLVYAFEKVFTKFYNRFGVPLISSRSFPWSVTIPICMSILFVFGSLGLVWRFSSGANWVLHGFRMLDFLDSIDVPKKESALCDYTWFEHVGWRFFSILATSHHWPSLDTVIRWSWQDSCAGNDDAFALRIRWGGGGWVVIGWTLTGSSPTVVRNEFDLNVCDVLWHYEIKPWNLIVRIVKNDETCAVPHQLDLLWLFPCNPCWDSNQSLRSFENI